MKKSGKDFCFLSFSHLSRTSDHCPGSILLLQFRFGDLGEYPGPGEGVDTSDEMVEEAESQVGEEEETQEDEDQLNDTVWSQTGHNSVHCVSQDTDHTRDTLSHTSHAV